MKTGEDGADKVDRSRRRFMKIAVLGGAGLGLGLYLGLGGERSHPTEEGWSGGSGLWTPNAWLSIDHEGRVTVRVNHSEMGQGVTTGLPTIVADELGADWTRVGFEIAPVEEYYKNPAMNVQMTGGSTSTPTSWDPLRRAGAVAREMLISAAAQRWKVTPDKCRAEGGAVIHPDGRTRLDFGELVAAASRLRPPHEIRLREPGEYRLIGTDVPRLDVADKISGKAVFGIDVQLPGLLTATVIHPPVMGDDLESFDDSNTMKIPGVRRVLPLGRGLAVAADTFWQARRGADHLAIRWRDGGLRNLNTPGLWRRWQGLADSGEAKELYSLGDVPAALSGAGQRVEAVYRVPFQAHATPEPMTCTAHVERDLCRVWAPTQNQDGVQEVAARLTGLAYTDVQVITTYMGGGFGRRGSVDYAAQAVELSRALARPVKVIWTREEDIRNDDFRPGSLNRLTAVLDGDGRPSAWSHRIVGPDQMSHLVPDLLPTGLPYWLPRGVRNLTRWASERFMTSIMAGEGVKTGAAPLHYAVPNVEVDYIHDNPGIRAGFWRSVGSSANAFVVERFMDELALAAGRDPVDYRLALLDPRPRAVLELAVRRSGYRDPRPPGVHLGAAIHEFHGAWVAMVARVRLDDEGRPVVERVTCGVDCGRVINPRNVRAQVVGGVVFGLTATIKGAITFRDGRVEQSNIHDFPLLAFDEMPEVDVHLIDSRAAPNGVGEIGVPPIAPAVANAVSIATGRPVRELPVKI